MPEGSGDKGETSNGHPYSHCAQIWRHQDVLGVKVAVEGDLTCAPHPYNASRASPRPDQA